MYFKIYFEIFCELTEIKPVRVLDIYMIRKIDLKNRTFVNK